VSKPITADETARLGSRAALEGVIPQDHPVRFVRDFVQQLDLLALGFKAPRVDAPGQPAFSSELLLGAWLYGYVRAIRSTRKLETACREQQPLIWLLGGRQPDHNTLWRFFRNNRAALREVFVTTVRVAAGLDLAGLVLHALDGTKITSACSTDTALHRKPLEEALTKLGDQAVEQTMLEIEQIEARSRSEARLPPEIQDVETRRAAINAQLARLAKADAKHLHPDEPDARMMRNHGRLEMAYNAQAVADENGYVVAQDVVSDENDAKQLAPMLDRVAENLGETAENTLVDDGYVTSPQLAKAHERERNIVIPPGPVSHETLGPYDKSKFSYDAERDVYVCPKGETLPFERLDRPRKRQAKLAVYRCHNGQCPVRSECTKDRGGRTVRRSPDDAAMRAQRDRQRDPEIAALYTHRKVMIEPIFAQVKWIVGFRRFTVRGLENVRTQWALICTTLNLKKLIKSWQQALRVPLTV
jgi:transposase